MNTYFDVLFYLLAAILILQKKYLWIPFLMFFAALNRETSLLIPAMMVIPNIDWKRKYIAPYFLIWGGVSVVVFFVVFFGVRLYFGYKSPEIVEGMRTPLDYLIRNFTYLWTYPLLAGALTFLPLLPILFLKRLPKILQQWFWVIIPAWFTIHYLYAIVAEARLFLVPIALILIPSFLIIIENWYGLNSNKAKAL